MCLTAACGGGNDSGLESSAKIGDLSDSERRTLCDWSLGLVDEPGATVICDDFTVTALATMEQCLDDLAGYALCTLTVGEYEACFRALAEDPCGLGSRACPPVFVCMGSPPDSPSHSE